MGCWLLVSVCGWLLFLDGRWQLVVGCWFLVFVVRWSKDVGHLSMSLCCLLVVG